MFNIQPGQGLGYPASREIAFGLGSFFDLGILSFSTDIGIVSNLSNIDFLNLHNLTSNIGIVSSLSDIDLKNLHNLASNIQILSNFNNIDVSTLLGIIEIVYAELENISRK